MHFGTPARMVRPILPQFALGGTRTVIQLFQGVTVWKSASDHTLGWESRPAVDWLHGLYIETMLYLDWEGDTTYETSGTVGENGYTIESTTYSTGSAAPLIELLDATGGVLKTASATGSGSVDVHSVWTYMDGRWRIGPDHNNQSFSMSEWNYDANGLVDKFCGVRLTSPGTSQDARLIVYDGNPFQKLTANE